MSSIIGWVLIGCGVLVVAGIICFAKLAYDLKRFLEEDECYD